MPPEGRSSPSPSRGQVQHHAGGAQAAFGTDEAENLRALFRRKFLNQLGLALDGVPDGADERRLAHLTFDQVILGAFANRSHSHFFVVGSAEHQQRDVPGLLAQPGEGFKTLAVGQVQVRDDDVDIAGGESLETFGKVIGPFDGKSFGSRKIVPDEAGIDGVVFNQQDIHCGWSEKHAAGRRNSRPPRTVYQSTPNRKRRV